MITAAGATLLLAAACRPVKPPAPPQDGPAVLFEQDAPGTATFTVPAGICSLTVEAAGAQGGSGSFGNAVGGRAASVTAVLDVVPGESLQITVGGAGGNAGTNGAAGLGGFNGGGPGGVGQAVDEGEGGGGGGGGGATDVRRDATGLDARIVVAAGGGGGAYTFEAGTSIGGYGGSTGQRGTNGHEGTASTAQGGEPGGLGGAGGAPASSGLPSAAGENGALGVGGAGGATGQVFGGGGGGGGVTGGGGGGGAGNDAGTGGGGGGGDSVTVAGTITDNAHDGDGTVTITGPDTPIPCEVVFDSSSPGTSSVALPPLVCSAVVVDAYGGAGGAGSSAANSGSTGSSSGGIGGLGAHVRETLSVTPGEVLQINIGGQGQNGAGFNASGAGGFNGGGPGGGFDLELFGIYGGAGGGGGASDVRRGTALDDRVVVAAGGGGGGGAMSDPGQSSNPNGGAGGGGGSGGGPGVNGEDHGFGHGGGGDAGGTAPSPSGGTSTGDGIAAASPGSAGAGGTGASAAPNQNIYNSPAGGGGGGGVVGGGGGGTASIELGEGGGVAAGGGGGGNSLGTVVGTQRVAGRVTISALPSVGCPYAPDAAPLDGDEVIGRYVFNQDGAGQTVGETTSREQARFDVRLYNDGTEADTFDVDSNPVLLPGYQVQFIDPSGSDITDEVTGGGYTTASVAPDGFVTLSVAITIPSGAPPGQNQIVLLTITSLGALNQGALLQDAALLFAGPSP